MFEKNEVISRKSFSASTLLQSSRTCKVESFGLARRDYAERFLKPTAAQAATSHHAFLLCLALLLVDPAGVASAPELCSSVSSTSFSSSSSDSSRLTALSSISGLFCSPEPTSLFNSACCSTFPASLSTPFISPHPLQRQRPTSSKLRAPGGACPFTSLHEGVAQISAKRFLLDVSSSPRTTSRMRSYQAGAGADAGAGCEKCEGKAFGAKDSFAGGCG